MKKFAFAFIAALSFSAFGLTGCGSGSQSVIEAPPADDAGAAVDGMSDDEYNKQMEKSMSEKG